MANGKTTKQIAYEMDLAEGTIWRHKEEMYKQIGLKGTKRPNVRLVTWFINLLKGEKDE